MSEMKTMLAATMVAAMMLAACNHGAAPSTASKVETAKGGQFEVWNTSGPTEHGLIVEGSTHYRAYCRTLANLRWTGNIPARHYSTGELLNKRALNIHHSGNDAGTVEIHKGMFAETPRQPGDRACAVNPIGWSGFVGTRRSREGTSYFQTREDVFTITSVQTEFNRSTPSASKQQELVKDVLTAAADVAIIYGYKYGEITGSDQATSGLEGETETRSTGSGRGTVHTLYGITFSNADTDVITKTTTDGQEVESSRTDTVKLYRDPPSHDNYFNAEIISRSIYGGVPKKMEFNDIDIGVWGKSDYTDSYISRGKAFWRDHKQFVLPKSERR